MNICIWVIICLFTFQIANNQHIVVSYSRQDHRASHPPQPHLPCIYKDLESPIDGNGPTTHKATSLFDLKVQEKHSLCQDKHILTLLNEEGFKFKMIF